MATDAQLREIRRRLESDYKCGWRTRVGIGVFQQIVDDVVDASEQCSILHVDCIPLDNHIDRVTDLTHVIELEQDTNKTLDRENSRLAKDVVELVRRIAELEHQSDVV